MKMRSVSLAWALSLLSANAIAAENMLAWCLKSYPSKTDWCNSQYLADGAAKNSAPVALSPAEMEPRQQVQSHEPEPDQLAVAPRRRRVFNSIHLADRGLAGTIKIGDTIKVTNGMGCFIYSLEEYRCVKLTFNRAAIVASPQISGVPREYMERNCFTATQGIKNPKCGFSPVFTVTGRGIDHAETAQLYSTDVLELRPGDR